METRCPSHGGARTNPRRPKRRHRTLSRSTFTLSQASLSQAFLGIENLALLGLEFVLAENASVSE